MNDKLQRLVRCGLCGHETGFRRNIVGLNKWLCGCECHITSTPTPTPKYDEYDMRYPSHAKAYVKSLQLFAVETPNGGAQVLSEAK